MEASMLMVMKDMIMMWMMIIMMIVRMVVMIIMIEEKLVVMMMTITIIIITITIIIILPVLRTTPTIQSVLRRTHPLNTKLFGLIASRTSGITSDVKTPVKLSMRLLGCSIVIVPTKSDKPSLERIYNSSSSIC